MITPSDFVSYLQIRRQSATLDCLGSELGVTRQAVHQWLRGSATPSATVLLLAERIMREPRELSSGLPVSEQAGRRS